MTKIRIGTRKSKLAMVQTELVVEEYKKVWHDFHYEIVPMSTEGDEQLNRSLSSFGGKGVFVTEIEKALKNGTIDLAVHSAKDLPLPIGEGLVIAATPKREDARDVLVMKRDLCDKLAKANNLTVPPDGESFDKQMEFLRACGLKNVGTGSMRRQYQLDKLIGAACREIRGNVTTRLSKLDTGDYDAVMLAAAGLKRLGLLQEEKYCYFYMEPEIFLPAPCQGIIAVESRVNDPLLTKYRLIEDALTARAFKLEREVMERTGGSCRDIVGALARQKRGGGQMELHVLFNGEYTKEIFADKEVHPQKKAYLVGAGPGAKELITLRGRRLIEQSDVLIYDALAGEELIQLAPAHCKKIFVGKRAGQHSMKQEDISKLLVSECKEGLTVVRLKGGDPFVFGRGGEEVEALLEAGIDYELVPGITSAVAAPELAGIPVTHRGVAGSFTVLTGHTKENGVITEDFKTLANLHGTIVVLMGVKHGAAIAKGLMEAGKSADTPTAFIENASLPTQRLVRGTLSEVEEIVTGQRVHAPAVLVIGDAAAFPMCCEPDKVALLGTEHFVQLMERKAGQISETEKHIKTFPIFSDCHNLEIVPAIKHLPHEIFENQWFLFTSGYGVTTFMELCQKDRIDLRLLSHIRFAVIGKDTAGFLKAYGIYPDFTAKRAEGYAFGKEFASFLHRENEKSSERRDRMGTLHNQIALLRAKKASPGLPKALLEENMVFTDYALYDTLPIEDANQAIIKKLANDNSNYKAIVMGSRSAAKAFLDAVEKSPGKQRLLEGKKLFGMGNGTREYLIEKNIAPERILIPESPGVEELVRLIHTSMRSS